ncbi:MAG: MerR family transcriptional regulator [Dehalococcoidia bacterium]
MRYSVKAAARATGITESRLRTWERRYGIPRPDRSDTGRRQYDDDDLAIIRRMSALVAAGMAASDAAEAARLSPASEAPALPVARPADHPLAAAMIEAAASYDEAAYVAALRRATEDLGWAVALETVILVALKRIGYAWMEASASVAVEHFASQIVRHEIGGALSALVLPEPDKPLLLLACPEAEEHELALLSLAYLLRAEGQRLVYLGADVPVSDLLSAIEAMKPAAVVLAATSDSGRASLVRASRSILAVRGPRLFIGGPAVGPELELAAGVRLPLSLREAVALIRRSLGD